VETEQLLLPAQLNAASHQAMLLLLVIFTLKASPSISARFKLLLIRWDANAQTVHHMLLLLLLTPSW
jgi:hypothetical protein